MIQDLLSAVYVYAISVARWNFETGVYEISIQCCGLSSLNGLMLALQQEQADRSVNS